MSCKYCGGSGVVLNVRDGQIIFCNSCIDAEKFPHVMELALRYARQSKDRKFTQVIMAIMKHLPKYTVMACLEAEAQGMPDHFVDMMRKIYGVRPLGNDSIDHDSVHSSKRTD